MTLKKSFFVAIVVSILCGNVFAVSPYAMTIQQNIQKKSFLAPVAFPTTAADASFITKAQVKRDDYIPYFDRSAFKGLSIEEIDELESMAERAEADRLDMLATASNSEYCLNYPDDYEHCPNNPTDEDLFAEQPENVYDDLLDGADAPTPTSNRYMDRALTPENIAQYNLKAFNGGCTPSERSNWWKNRILTTGKYERIDSAFEKFMITAFRKEGGCIKHPNDPGGYTCYGCASNGLCHGINMRNITRGKVEDLVYRNMYKAYHVDRLPDAFRGYAMWGIWGSGPKTGINLFQTALGVPRTGQIDAATITAAKEYRGDFGARYTKAHEKFYRNLVAAKATRRVFLRGWLNSLSLLRTSGCHVVPTNPIHR